MSSRGIVPEKGASASTESPPLTDLVRDTTWLTDVVGIQVDSATAPEPIREAGGLVGTLARVVLNAESESPRVIVLKYIAEEGLASSRSHGLAREAQFFQDLAPKLNMPGLPRVYWARGDLETGAKEILMEDLGDCVQCGYLFGPGSPHNWGKDLAALTRSVVGVSAEQVTRVAFRSAARLHARHWGRHDEIMEHRAWLRGAQWVTGEGRDSWEAAQRTVQQAWAALREPLVGAAAAPGEDESAGTVEHKGVRWSRSVVRVVDASLARVSWDKFQEAMQSDTLTLVHGDFHPANAMVRPARDTAASSGQDPELVLLDWENVGVGSGPQDLAQWVISHMAPEERAQCERQLVEDYAATLAAELPDGSDAPPFAEIWAEYVRGGSERWIWLLVLLSTMVPPPAMQYFHDQVAAFCADHGVTSDNVGQPRV